MDISVVIVAWNAKRYLEICLESLIAAPPRCSFEVIVVDNASSDDTVEMIEARYSWVKLIKSSENLGFSKGNNVGIRQSEGRYISLVNPDVQVLPGCLDALADLLDQNPHVGCVGPRVLNPDMTLQSSCRRFPTLWNNFCTAAGLATAFKSSRLFAGEHMFYFPHDRTMAVNILVGCFTMVRRETFDAVGLLDEGLFMYGDDVDWCRRAWNAGWQVVFFPGAQAIHDRGKITAPYPVCCRAAAFTSLLLGQASRPIWTVGDPNHLVLPSLASLRIRSATSLGLLVEIPTQRRPCSGRNSVSASARVRESFNSAQGLSEGGS
jgi:GT2 family glycosyltransferase